MYDCNLGLATSGAVREHDARLVGEGQSVRVIDAYFQNTTLDGGFHLSLAKTAKPCSMLPSSDGIGGEQQGDAIFDDIIHQLRVGDLRRGHDQVFLDYHFTIFVSSGDDPGRIVRQERIGVIRMVVPVTLDPASGQSRLDKYTHINFTKRPVKSLFVVMAGAERRGRPATWTGDHLVGGFIYAADPYECTPCLGQIQ
ncbi:unnamed protein product [Clonostachys rosea]|uniref:Uncharacterized protein n=1 Tax=Bionectria ochroleuca TaxID=29856 RepID=A0ABY6UQF7_BIOOC|nr:unnamed protein product [Clonostachys rosea]